LFLRLNCETVFHKIFVSLISFQDFQLTNLTNYASGLTAKLQSWSCWYLGLMVSYTSLPVCS